MMHPPPCSTRPVVRLRKEREKTLLRYHHWIFSGAIASVSPQPSAGDLIDVVDAEGNFLATGTWESAAISVRVLSFGQPLEDIESFLREHIEAALQLRLALGFSCGEGAPGGRSNIFRLVYGEADFLSGLVIDIYGKTAVVQAHSAGMYRQIETIKDILLALPDYPLEAVYDKSNATLPDAAVCSEVGDRYLAGRRDDTPHYENGLQFITDFEHGQKTGFFIDQRYNRSLVEKFANGRKVLNMFSYTGGFSVYALRGEAKEVVSLDSSGRALDIARKTVSLNFSEEVSARHKTVAADAFDYLYGLEGGEYDLIILDPPAFAKRRSSVKNACNGYRKLNAAALKKIASGGLLFTFSCSQLVSSYDFKMAVLTAAVESRRRVRILHQLSQSDDHPIALYHPESEYLKGLLLHVE